MNQEEINARFAEINMRDAEEPTPEDLAAISAAESEDSMSLAEFKQELEGYSGKLVIRIPRSLHKDLKDKAAIEGVSLNQYLLYKLAR